MSPSLRHLIAVPAILAVTCAQASCAPAIRPAALHGGIEARPYSSFGIALYKELLKEKPGVNIFISPASVGFALAMTYNGSGGETRTAMAGTLGFPDDSFEAVNLTDSTLIRDMNDSIPGVKLSVANSLWAKQGLTFKKSFLERNTRYYGAEIETLDFSSPGAPATINQWVARKTNDKITKIVDKIREDDILYLINAIYFKGTWTREFDKNLTRDEPFHLLAGAASPRPMMRQSGKYDYLEEDGFQAVRLPYGDGRIGMYVFLPAGGSSLELFHEKLSSGSWDEWMRSFASRKGSIVLPHFKLEYEASLKQSLAALGMAVAFDPERANFTGMYEAAGRNVYIGDVMHKTFVDVNEEGTEAAAVTSVEMRLTTTAMEPERPFEMIVDRPFFFAIRDEKTGLVLFMGSIVNPE